MTPLISFPEPYPDEDFRSLVYRFHIRSSNGTLVETNMDLFEKKSGKYSIFPNKLITFLRKLPIGNSYSLDYFILNHTWYGLIFAFMKNGKRNDLTEVIKYGSENKFYISSNVPNNLFSRTIRYCPLCLKEDVELYGEFYIHRKHQITFMDFCHKHFVLLIDKCSCCDADLTSISYEGLKNRPCCKNGHDLTRVTKTVLIGELEQLKIDVFNLICFFNENYQTFNSEKITHKILMGLWHKKYIQYKGRILKKELIFSIISEYGNLQLQAISLSPGQIRHRSYVARVLSKELNQDIIFYCLLILYLFHSKEEFVNYHIDIANPIPFGQGPWKCLNKICDGFNNYVISKNKRIAKNSGGTVISAEFECPICGQIYVKRWHPNQDKKEKVMIKTMGGKWINRLLELYLNGDSSYEIARKLECSEFGVRNNLNRIVGSSNVLTAQNREAVKQIIQSYWESAGTSETDRKKEEFRNVVVKILISCESISRTNLSKKIPYVYQWLKMNDIEWLESALPLKETNKKVPEDLTHFDEQLSVKIQKVSEELYKTCPYQIKKTTILKKLSKIEMNRLKSMSSRLPLSTVLLNKNIESLNDYFIRRVPFVIANLLKYGYKNITLKSLESYVKNYSKCDLDTQKKIKEYLKEMGFYE
ncbi:TnsD family Tn7-like transposition protein [Neobacillus sp. WH10]|uniref:TnsD family Tn7-like transposition protein n=1 Tax=Neobacillus sp. WH10 TaxID=3047873 RepID=UPI0024C1F811|nr:TnsD family Tn7-like transposition protein [Neobacillus sp. WH10]WHY77805.1 TnsD family Tn7-like transposition protein [Neobacillus sp. WH10]